MRKNNSLLFYLTFGILTLFFSVNSFAQDESEADKTIILGEEFKAGWLHNFLFGSQWRDLWTTPISIPVLDIHSFDGGIKPHIVEDNQETRSLKFIGNNDQLWEFHPINKNPSELLPDALHYTFVDGLLQDQISSANPFAKIICAELFNAVGINQSTPILILLPNDETLSEFAGQPGIIEISLQDNETSNEMEKINEITELFNSIENESNAKIDSEEFLKIRLMNLLVGNWYRDIDQWRWTRIKKDSRFYWRPEVNDRERAFAKFDGLLPYAATFVFPQLTSFKENFPPIGNLTHSGRNIDRIFLTELSKSKWDSIAVFIQNSLTDDVIKNAVDNIPAVQLESTKEKLISHIKARRNELNNLCDDYYRLINGVADVYGTNKNDYLIIERLNNEQTSVKIFPVINQSDFVSEDSYFNKVFDNSITDEIRIYLLDGDDYAFIKGEVDTSPLIRIIGGEGKDTFINESKVNGYFLSITPFKKAETKTEFYYGDDETIFLKGSGTNINTERWNDPINNNEKFEPTQKDRGHSWGFLPEAGYSTTDGVIIGGMFDLFSYNFRKVPYEYLQRLRFIYAFLPQSYKLEYFGEFIDVLGSTDLVIDIVKSELSFSNYFGFGNENVFDRYLYRDKYYWLEQELVFINPQLRYNFNEETSLSLGFFYEFNNSKLRNQELIDSFPHNNYGIGNLQHAGLNFKFLFDSRENEFYPKAGRYINISGSYFNELLDTRDNYLRAEFDFRNYIPFKLPFETTLALRSSGGKVWGKFPFYHAIFIGGEENVRAYTRKRFSGDTSISLQSEVRVKFVKSRILVKGDLGMHLFAETGRVFAANQISDDWHPSFGVGIWASSVNRIFVFSLTYAFGTDEQNIYFDTRMVF